MANELTSFVVNGSTAVGIEEDETPIASMTPRFSFSAPHVVSLAPGTGADACNAVGYIQGDATTSVTPHVIGSAAVSKAPSIRPGQDGETFSILRWFRIYNLSTVNELLVWGGTNAPAGMADELTIPPCTASNPSYIEMAMPGAAGLAIGGTDRLNITAGAGTVPYLALLAGEP